MPNRPIDDCFDSPKAKSRISAPHRCRLPIDVVSTEHHTIPAIHRNLFITRIECCLNLGLVAIGHRSIRYLHIPSCRASWAAYDAQTYLHLEFFFDCGDYSPERFAHLSAIYQELLLMDVGAGELVRFWVHNFASVNIKTVENLMSFIAGRSESRFSSDALLRAMHKCHFIC